MLTLYSGLLLPWSGGLLWLMFTDALCNNHQANRRNNLYLHHWELAPVVDGYADEWSLFEGNFTRYRLPDGSLGLELAVGEHAGQAYLLVRVSDTSRTYGTQGDRVDLSLSDGVRLTRLRIQPHAPGWIVGQRLQGRRWVAEPALRRRTPPTSRTTMLLKRSASSLRMEYRSARRVVNRSRRLAGCQGGMAVSSEASSNA